jgi:hypothetical protein
VDTAEHADAAAQIRTIPGRADSRAEQLPLPPTTDALLADSIEQKNA